MCSILFLTNTNSWSLLLNVWLKYSVCIIFELLAIQTFSPYARFAESESVL